MSNKISLDLTANTSQAEKAVADLANDIDKLQKKATQTNISGGGRGSRYSRNRQAQQDKNRPQGSTRSSGQSGAQLDRSAAAISDALGEITNSLGNFGKNLNEVKDKFIDFAAKISLLEGTFDRWRNRQAEKAAGNVKPNAITALRNDPIIARSNLRAQRYNNRITGLRNALGSFEGRDDLTDAEITRVGRLQRQLNRYERLASVNSGRIRARFEHLMPEQAFGPGKGRLTSDQRYLRGLIQWNQGGVIGSPGQLGYRNYSTRFMGMNTTRLSGLTNMARGTIGSYLPEGTGSALMKAGRFAGAAGAGALAGAAIGAVGGGIYGAATGAGAGLGLGALSLPYLLKRGSDRVDAGRGKAEEFTKLNAQLSVLTKNLTGSSDSARVLAEQIQKMGIEGAVPVEQLSRGASMLMLAFKGNQTEASKWLNILGDMSAGTGQSVEYFAELITKANQFGTVEFEVFNQLNEKGIPIIDQLKGKFGNTREEIMKAAQAGKITAQEFMKAFEAAHKASMEGTNAVKAASTLTDLRRQRAEYEQMEAAHYTQSYDNVMSEYERERTERARRRSEDASHESEARAFGNMLADLSVFFKRLKNVLTDWIDDVPHWFARMTGMVDSQAGADIAATGLWITGTRVMEDGVKMVGGNKEFERRQAELRAYVNEDGIDEDERARRRLTLADFESDYWYSSAELSGALESAKDKRDELQRQANDQSYKPETRAKAAAELEEAEDLVRKLENSLEEAVKREQEIAEARRIVAAAEQREKAAEETRTAFIRDNAKTDREMLDAYGFNGVADVEREMEAIKRRILNQSAEDPEAEAERYEELADLLEAIQKYRDAQRRDAEQAAKQAEEAAKREAKARRDRELYLLEREAHRNPENYEAAYQLQFEQQADKLKSLGFSETEASEMIAEDRAEAIRNAERRLATNDEAMQKEKQAIEDNKKTGVEGIENAWGAVQRTMTSFTSPYEQSQLKELQKVNDNLVKEIDALNRINLPPTAR